jgi:hypothetical protein
MKQEMESTLLDYRTGLEETLASGLLSLLVVLVLLSFVQAAGFLVEASEFVVADENVGFWRLGLCPRKAAVRHVDQR